MELYRKAVPAPAALSNGHVDHWQRIERTVWVAIGVSLLATVLVHWAIAELAPNGTAQYVLHTGSAIVQAFATTAFILRRVSALVARRVQQEVALRAQRERALRLDGALLMARTVVHEVNNALSPVTGFAELLLVDPAVQSHAKLQDYAHQIFSGAQQAAERVARLGRIVRLEEDTSFAGAAVSVLDLDRSIATSVTPPGNGQS